MLFLPMPGGESEGSPTEIHSFTAENKVLTLFHVHSLFHKLQMISQEIPRSKFRFCYNGTRNPVAIILNGVKDQRRTSMAEPERIGPKETYEKLKSGAVILVCAYEDDKKFNSFHLAGALSFNEFRSKPSSLSKGREIIFYCA